MSKLVKEKREEQILAILRGTTEGSLEEGAHQEIPDQLAQAVGKGKEIDGELAGLNVVLDERVVGLIVVNKLDDVEEVVLTQLGEGVGHLLKVPTRLTFLAVISLARLGRTGVIVGANGAGRAEEADQVLGRVLETDRVDVVVLGRAEVQVVEDGNLAALLGRVHVDRHLELAPSFILAGEGRLVECLSRKS